MRLTLIANPDSGGSTSPDAIAERLRAHGAEVVVHPIAELDTFPVGTAERLVIASGDGGVGSAAARAAREGLPLAVVPSGTANDFARALDLPTDLDAAARLAADPAARTDHLDVGDADGRPFLNVASCGMAVLAAAHAKGLKRYLGPLAYPVGAIAAGVTGVAERTRVVVDGEEVFAGKAWQVLVAGTGAFGGGAVVGPVDLDDAQLDVAILTARGRHRLAVHAVRMRFGGLTSEDDVHHHRGRRIRVVVPGDWNVDGERLPGDGDRTLRVRARVEVVVRERP